ncbi:MAG: MarR family transcriptional regulator [Thermoleophilia bacterium]|nr:MarR family transcriptional regulator [Thermoleophilia bacterium]
MEPASTSTHVPSANEHAWNDVLAWMVASESYIAQLRSTLGLSAHEMNVLLTLRTDGTTTISDLALRVQLSRPALTNMVQRLQRHGWITRKIHASDRRKVMLAATERFDQQLVEHSTPWRHRLRNLASASDHWEPLRVVLDDVGQIARRSAWELQDAGHRITHPDP